METKNLGASPSSRGIPVIHWANNSAEYAELCDSDPHSITLLDPHDPIRRERWMQAICWYASCLTFIPPNVQPQPEGLIISFDDGAGTDVIGSVLAKQLGRAHKRLKIIDELPNQLIPDCRIIIVARREALDLATLGRLHRKLDSIGSTLGILTATDLPALSFVAAKCRLSPSIPPSEDFVLDAVYGEQASLNDLINQPDGWRMALLMAHGEGAHLYLGSGVLCGLLGTHEMIGDSRVPGGCSVEDCKRARKAQLATVHADSLRCRIMALLSCNSFSVARELYPSNSSLVLAAVDGWPAAVIANPTSMEFSPVHSHFLQHLLNHGTLLGDAVATLNRTLRVSSDYPPYILLGDPLCRVMPSITTRDNERPSEPATQSVHIIPRNNESAYDLTPWIQESSLVGHSAVFLLKDSCHPSSPTMSNKTSELDRLQALVKGVGQRLVNVNNWLSILISLGSGDAFDDLLTDLRVSTARVQYSLAALAQVVSNIHKLSVWDPSVYELQGDLHEAIAAWDAGFALMIHDHLLGGGGEPVGDKVIELLTRTHFLETQSQGSACSRCGTPTTNDMYRCLITGTQSQLQDCTLCGPLSAAPSINVRLDVEVNSCVRLDEAFAARVNLSGSKEPGFLVIEFRDKSHPGAKLRTVDTWSEDTTSRLLPLSLAGSGCDQHSIRAVWVGGLEWVYARRVLSVIPPLS